MRRRVGVGALSLGLRRSLSGGAISGAILHVTRLLRDAEVLVLTHASLEENGHTLCQNCIKAQNGAYLWNRS